MGMQLTFNRCYFARGWSQASKNLCTPQPKCLLCVIAEIYPYCSLVLICTSLHQTTYLLSIGIDEFCWGGGGVGKGIKIFSMCTFYILPPLFYWSFLKKLHFIIHIGKEVEERTYTCKTPLIGVLYDPSVTNKTLSANSYVVSASMTSLPDIMDLILCGRRQWRAEGEGARVSEPKCDALE